MGAKELKKPVLGAFVDTFFGITTNGLSTYYGTPRSLILSMNLNLVNGDFPSNGQKSNMATYRYHIVVVVVVRGSGRHFALEVGHIVGPLNYSRCDTKHRLPCTITPFY